MNDAILFWLALLGVAFLCSASVHAVLHNFVLASLLGGLASAIVFHAILYYVQGGLSKMWQIGFIVNLAVAIVVSFVTGLVVKRLRRKRSAESVRP